MRPGIVNMFMCSSATEMHYQDQYQSRLSGVYPILEVSDKSGAHLFWHRSHKKCRCSCVSFPEIMFALRFVTVAGGWVLVVIVVCICYSTIRPHIEETDPRAYTVNDKHPPMLQCLAQTLCLYTFEAQTFSVLRLYVLWLIEALHFSQIIRKQFFRVTDARAIGISVPENYCVIGIHRKSFVEGSNLHKIIPASRPA